MKTDTRFWAYLFQFLLELEMFQTKFEKIKTTLFVSVSLRIRNVSDKI
jgi:hypothetical protein